MARKKRLGEMLLEAGLINEAGLQEALKNHKKKGLKLGQYLVRQGVLQESQIIDIISELLKVEKYHPDKYPMDVSLTKLVPAELAKRYQLVPLHKKGHLLTVAMLDPMDIEALDAVELLANVEVEPLICTEQELTQIMGSLYGVYTELGHVLESVEEIGYQSDEQEKGPGTEDLSVSNLQGLAEEAPVVRLVNSILSQAIRDRASDVHISPEKNIVRIRFRVDGKLHDVPAPLKSMFLAVVSRLKILGNMDIAVSRVPQDGRFTIKMEDREINIRVSSLPTIYGENLVLRLLDSSGGMIGLDRLGMRPEDKEKLLSVMRKPYGMILSTGPTGSGKSTSLYSILKELNQPDVNIITVEDPVEYRIERIRQVQLNRKAGMTFASGLRSILRQDPDIIMVGEIRDTETAAIAVQAALTGHRMLSTVHTNDAAGAVTRFMDMGIEPFLISSVMLVSFAQRLVRKICPYCKESYVPPPETFALWGLEEYEGTTLYRGAGCYQCLETGYMGRTGVFEVLVIDEMVQDMILKRQSAQEITRVVQKEGKLRTLKEDALEKVFNGITTLEEAASSVMT